MTKMSLTIVKIAAFRDNETETLNTFPVYIAVFITQKAKNADNVAITMMEKS